MLLRTLWPSHLRPKTDKLLRCYAAMPVSESCWEVLEVGFDEEIFYPN